MKSFFAAVAAVGQIVLRLWDWWKELQASAKAKQEVSDVQETERRLQSDDDNAAAAINDGL